jgi:hypothetical protein
MTLLSFTLDKSSAPCEFDGHTWVLRRYQARHGHRSMRMCSECSRNEVVLPVDRPREHFAAHARRRATTSRAA